MNKKFEFTGETKTFNFGYRPIVLHRIRADCRAVKGRWCRGMTNNDAKEFLMSFKNDNNWGTVLEKH